MFALAFNIPLEPERCYHSATKTPISGWAWRTHSSHAQYQAGSYTLPLPLVPIAGLFAALGLVLLPVT